MHKIRNTAHKELLETMYLQYAHLMSKRQLRELLQSRRWDEHKVRQMIKDDTWWYRFVED